MLYRMKVVHGYSTRDDLAETETDGRSFNTLSGAQIKLRAINLKIGSMLAAGEYLPRIDIIDETGKVWKWGS